MKRLYAALLIAVLLPVACLCAASGEGTALPVRSIILLIPDGMSPGGVTLARWMKAFDPATGMYDPTVRLAMDDLASGLVRTYWASPEGIGAVTDSAPAASAMATGHKTGVFHLAVSPDGRKRPLATLVEGARSLGKATGIVATAMVQHATPAGFTAHHENRGRYDALGEQQVYQGMDVVMGGGAEFLMPGNRGDGEDLLSVIQSLGYAYVTTASEMMEVTSGRLWRAFAPEHMAYEMDRQLISPDEPSLADMTRKAIQLLSADEDGFFLMVEGSKVDMAAHAHDVSGVVSDILAFDDAVQAALDFAQTDGRTMVLAVTDHHNGGITIGDAPTSSTSYAMLLDEFMAPLRRVTLTGEGMEKMMDAQRTNAAEIVAQYAQITDLTAEELASLENAQAGMVNYAFGEILSRRAHIGWTTSGHTGEDVTLYSYLPGNGRITGLKENTDIARLCADAFGMDLDALTGELFMDANAHFSSIGADVTLDESDGTNPVLVIQKQGKTLRIPENKNFVILDGRQVMLDSVIVQSAGVFYVPRAVIDLM